MILKRNMRGHVFLPRSLGLVVSSVRNIERRICQAAEQLGSTRDQGRLGLWGVSFRRVASPSLENTKPRWYPRCGSSANSKANHFLAEGRTPYCLVLCALFRSSFEPQWPKGRKVVGLHSRKAGGGCLFRGCLWASWPIIWGKGNIAGSRNVRDEIQT